ncbi:hypothetical protein A3A79_00530 [Candidatus Gottesmanbacteria bacterium RIFCSPLOWO2_01_FULL_43_11b]|uniref:Prepilin-type N-terminal cleavage/methylation domain-containing protein n=1 Tax=Candidatus Gottesmanbacteria bacterium RIFCSPLOWO2_01_FULL_43_11b TaxID=1798392 RepID=A0A1F6AG08_9BACT|nr:MAG: hypothetical protein A3A79_00530 [Candidatus Gottesmanbacteria bacterium RIFCSPLOWO2_01_FULL_43_11b]
MKKSQPAHWRGFTLIEILVSVGIIAIVGSVIAQSFFSMVRTNIKTNLLTTVKQNGDFSLSVMSRMIRNASSVTTTCSSGGTTTSSLSLLNTDGNSTTFDCQMDGTIARIASTSATRTEYLTNQNVTLGSSCTNALTFICTDIAEEKKEIQILFTLSQLGTPEAQFEKASTQFQTTVVTRQ